MSDGRRIQQPGEVVPVDRRQGERRSSKRNPYWQQMVDHINDTWKAKKGNAHTSEPEYNYPFTGRDFKALKHWSGMYLETGIMALWDEYLERADEWTLKAGLSIQEFERQLPRLVDDYKWKTRREKYQIKFPDDIPHEIDELFAVIPLKVIKPAIMPSHNQKWALANPTDPRAKKYLK